MTEILAPFQESFMQRAFIVAVIIGALCSVIGTYVVLRKLAFMGDGLAHASFAGIVIAYMRGANFYLGAAAAAIITALGIGFIHRRGNLSLDSSVGVLFTGVFSLGVFLMSRAARSPIDLQSFLFGSILAVSANDLFIVATLGFVVAVIVALLWRPLLYTSFDPIVARAVGIRVAFVDYTLLVVVALTIIISVQTVGIVLVAALLVTPAAAASMLTKRFVRLMMISCGIGVCSTVVGLYLSYQFQASSGATIVLLATLIFFAALATSAIRRRFAIEVYRHQDTSGDNGR